MIHLCKCCSSACDSCGRCCAKTCTKCCKCIEACCSCCCKCMNNFFEKPFSFCTFITFFVVFCPGLIGIVISIITWKNNKYCEKNMNLWALVSSLLHILNFVFVVYLYVQLNREEYNRLNDPDKTLCNSNKFCDKLYRFFCYDWFVLLCIFAFIFEFIWTIIGISWKDSISSVCETDVNPLIGFCGA